MSGLARQYENSEIQAARLLGSLLLFTQVFYKLRTGRDFVLSNPTCRESHFITICKALTRVARGECRRLIINVAPRYGKTELLINFIAWCLARYPDSNFLYISYAALLAKKQTQTIRQIINMPAFKELFHVELSKESSAKDNFETTAGGSVYAAGAEGTITGRGAGITNCERFGGAIIIDDIHKPTEVMSETMRTSTNDWYKNTMQSRVNDAKTPIIFIGQRLHEDDLPANLMNGFDGEDWESLILPSLDEVGNALYPEKHTADDLRKMQEVMPYDFASQHLQTPIPAGGGLFNPEWFILIDEIPPLLNCFITCDTAETSNKANDATVLSFWGVHKILDCGEDTGLLGLVWLDCLETWVEPVDLEALIMEFYVTALRCGYRPDFAAIEKKSSGSYLCSILKKRQGLRIIEIARTSASGSKSYRFKQIQAFVGNKLISLPRFGHHTKHVIDHCKKITANDTHALDDIADTLVDAVNLALINPIAYKAPPTKISSIIEKSKQANALISSVKNNSYQGARAWPR